MAENTARIGGGAVLKKRWIDFAEPELAREDDRPAEEIIADVIERAGIELL